MIYWVCAEHQMTRNTKKHVWFTHVQYIWPSYFVKSWQLSMPWNTRKCILRSIMIWKKAGCNKSQRKSNNTCTRYTFHFVLPKPDWQIQTSRNLIGLALISTTELHNKGSSNTYFYFRLPPEIGFLYLPHSRFISSSKTLSSAVMLLVTGSDGTECDRFTLEAVQRCSKLPNVSAKSAFKLIKILSSQ